LTASTWFDDEPPLRPAAVRAFARLLRRGRTSWKTWVFVAVGLAVASTYMSTRGPRMYAVTVALRVSEGAVRAGGAHLNGGALRAHVDDLAFTAKHLVEVMRKHPDTFGPLDKNVDESVAEMRDGITVEILENDFIGDRTPDGPPRSARVEVTYKSDDPKLTWAIAQELGELVIGTTMGEARAAIARARAAAASAVSQAEAHAEGAAAHDHDEPDAPPAAGPRPPDPLVVKANERLQLAGGQEAEADLSLKALDQRQSLRFEFVDPGQVPKKLPRLTGGTLVGILVVALFGSWLLVGGLDPRVLDFEDLAACGLPALGGLPPLPVAPARGSIGKSEEASDVPRARV
jgi:hypothetical protein